MKKLFLFVLLFTGINSTWSQELYTNLVEIKATSINTPTNKPDTYDAGSIFTLRKIGGIGNRFYFEEIFYSQSPSKFRLATPKEISEHKMKLFFKKAHMSKLYGGMMFGMSRNEALNEYSKNKRDLYKSINFGRGVILKGNKSCLDYDIFGNLISITYKLRDKKGFNDTQINNTLTHIYDSFILKGWTTTKTTSFGVILKHPFDDRYVNLKLADYNKDNETYYSIDITFGKFSNLIGDVKGDNSPKEHILNKLDI